MLYRDGSGTASGTFVRRVHRFSKSKKYGTKYILAVYFCAPVYIIESVVKKIIENVFPLLKILSFGYCHEVYLLNPEASL